MKILLAFCLLCLSLGVSSHEWNTNPQASSLAISLVFDAQGNLWRVLEKNGLIFVDSSHDLGKSFTGAVQVTASAQKIALDGEARPKIAIGPEGNIYLTWTEALKNPLSDYIWFSRSINGGKSFEKPTNVHSDHTEITRRFDALNVSSSGKVTVTWIAKRDLNKAKTEDKPYEGAAIYYGVSNNQGASFESELKLADRACECCRIALTNKPDGTVVAMWPHVFERGEGDHMIAEIPVEPNQTPELRRATFGRWKIDGCSLQGAALATGGDGKDWWGYHMAWFDGGQYDSGKDATLFYARMDGVAWVSSPPKKIGKHMNQAGHPALLTMDEKVWLVWLEIESKNNLKQNMVLGMYSDDDGRSWSEAKELANSASKADSPSLIANGNQAYLVWNTEKEGLTLIGL